MKYPHVALDLPLFQCYSFQQGCSVVPIIHVAGLGGSAQVRSGKVWLWVTLAISDLMTGIQHVRFVPGSPWKYYLGSGKTLSLNA